MEITNVVGKYVKRPNKLLFYFIFPHKMMFTVLELNLLSMQRDLLEIKLEF